MCLQGCLFGIPYLSCFLVSGNNNNNINSVSNYLSTKDIDIPSLVNLFRPCLFHSICWCKSKKRNLPTKSFCNVMSCFIYKPLLSWCARSSYSGCWGRETFNRNCKNLSATRMGLHMLGIANEWAASLSCNCLYHHPWIIHVLTKNMKLLSCDALKE